MSWCEWILRWIVTADEVIDDVRMPHTFFEGSCISNIKFLMIGLAIGGLNLEARYTVKTTRPRSPVTLRCLFAISSLKGTTTVHPRDAGSA